MFPEISDKEIDVDKECWLNGFVAHTNVSYGSKYDGDYMCVGVCDNCVKVLKEAGELNHIRYQF